MRVKRKDFAVGLTGVMAALAALAAVPANAQTSGALSLAWIDPLPGGNITTYQPVTHVSGAVSLLYADPATHAPTIKTVGAGREQLGTVRLSGESFAAVGKNGDAYFAASSKLTARSTDGTLRWTATLPDACGSPTRPVNVAVGADGSVYALAAPPVVNQCAESFQLVKYNALTGANEFTKVMGDWPTTYSIAAYKTGVTVQQDKTVRYFDASGAETGSFAGSSTDVRVNADGTAIYAVSHTATVSDGCMSTGPLVDRILFRTTAGAQVQANLHDCTEAYWMQPLASGGALVNELGGGAGTLVGVNASGAVIWRKAYPSIVGDTSRIAYLTAKSDGNGNIVVVQQTVTGNRYAVDVHVLDATTGAEQASFNTDSLDAAASFLWMSANGVPDSIGVTPNRLYLTLAKCAAGASCDAALYAFDLNGLTLDYPRAGVWGIGGQDPGPTATPSPEPTQTPVRMVVMGDSFSSGEGVEPFDPATTIDRGKNANLCHRSELAYAHRVVQDRNNVQLVGFFACSGATTSNLTKNAQYPTQAVQVKSLGKVKGVGVVALSVGGNDIHFKDFATTCATQKDVDCARQYKTSLQIIKNDLPGALKKTYAAVRGVVSAQTQVLILGYPTIVTYDSSKACSFPTNTALDAFKRTLAISLEDELNATIKTAVRQAGSNFVFVDAASPTSPFWGHELCNNDPYFNGPMWPQEMYSFHPNAKGQKAYAQLVEDEIQKKGFTLAVS